MTVALWTAGAALWVGTTLLASLIPWMSRPPLTRRLAPYLPGAPPPPAAPGPAGALARVVVPPAREAATRVARAVGVAGEAERRLDRVGSGLDVAGFRTHQGLGALGAWAVVAVVALAAGWPPTTGAVVATVAAAAAFLAGEQRLAGRARRWQEEVEAQLPVLAEQLALLLGAGWSVPGGLDRLARRATGACAADLQRVVRRIGQGLSEHEALAEWVERVEVPAVDRLVAVLALDRETTDLGRLIAEESRAAREEANQRVVARLDRRAQQVWIPVTVAALVPGTVFLAIPFVAALQELAA